jgi:hypothetical protein
VVSVQDRLHSACTAMLVAGYVAEAFYGNLANNMYPAS